MVLALALPFDFPNRTLLIDLTFGVVIVSIVVQGMTMHRLIKWRRLEGDGAADRTSARDPDALPVVDA
jgi:CPA1 family monovalent cation:H+ antiporter